MRDHIVPVRKLGLLLIALSTVALIGCATEQSEQPCEAPAEGEASTNPDDLWDDATRATIGATGKWTNKVELADANGDKLVDVLFANGGGYDSPGEPTLSQVFLNQGTDQKFEEATRQVFGHTPMLARVIKVRDVNADGSPDILVGTTYETQSRLYVGDGSGNFRDVTETHLPQVKASVGDLEFGDMDGDEDLADWGPDSPMMNEGGRTMLWLNDGKGRFTDATEARMPDALVKLVLLRPIESALAATVGMVNESGLRTAGVDRLAFSASSTSSALRLFAMDQPTTFLEEVSSTNER